MSEPDLRFTLRYCGDMIMYTHSYTVIISHNLYAVVTAQNLQSLPSSPAPPLSLPLPCPSPPFRCKLHINKPMNYVLPVIVKVGEIPSGTKVPGRLSAWPSAGKLCVEMNSDLLSTLNPCNLGFCFILRF